MRKAANVGAAYAEARQCLARAGIPTAGLDARLLVAHALGEVAGTILGRRERDLSGEEADRLQRLVARRARREPLARIVGYREFWSLPFKVSAATLIPRPESETLVEAALAWVDNREAAISVLDLGTGCGCLLLSVLSEFKRAQGVGLDVEPGALAIARDNAEGLGLAGRARFVRGDWTASLKGKFEVILANPPYVAEADLAGLEPEVTDFEPLRALTDGADGLDSYRAIIPRLPDLLAPQGAAFLEVGGGQDEVAELLGEHGLRLIECRNDLAGRPRCLVTALAKRSNKEKKV